MNEAITAQAAAVSIGLLPSIGNTLLFVAVGIVITAIFTWTYIKVTPYDELALIREDNQAAAFALGGAVLGFVITLSAIIRQSHSVVDVTVWGLIALVLQLAIWGLMHLWIGDLERRMRDGDTASGITLGSFSVALGWLNAACLTA